MDVFLAIVSALLLLAGFVGALLPVLPGPPLSWLGILLIHFTTYAQISTTFIVVTAVIMIAITILDLYIPIWGTKKFGGTKAGIYGSTVGLILGLFFFPPFGVIVGPFLGAFVGELVTNSRQVSKALRSATGSFIGFLLGSGIKLAFCGVMFYYWIDALFLHH